MNITEQFLKFALFGAEWVMYVLIACSVLSMTIIVDRIIFFSKLRGDFGEFIKGLTARLTAGEKMESIASWASAFKMLEASVAVAGLERAGDNLRSAEESMNATIIAARTKLDRGLTVLGTLGNNTPFIGLLGTIIGIIQAFDALKGNTKGGPEVVMGAISEALVATAVGLLVAIPAVVAYNFLQRQIKKKMSNSEETARIVITHMGKTRTE
jgi:biopolymer transport protein ExbB